MDGHVTYPLSAGGTPSLKAGSLPRSVVEAALAADAPGFLYDPALAAATAAALKQALPSWARVCYAIKANGYGPLVEALAPHVDGFEVASASEIAHARSVRPDGLVVCAGPGKSLRLLRELVAHRADVINVESVLELRRVAQVAAEAGVVVDVALRVNPRWADDTGSLTMGGAGTVFGIAEPDVPGVLDLAAGLPSVRVVGLHLHALSDNRDADKHVRYVAWCLDLARRTFAGRGLELAVLDVGGGLGVPFGDLPFGSTAPLDVDRLGSGLDRLDVPEGCAVVFEPGRYLVAESGWYAARVVDVKKVWDTWFAVLEGGINHFALSISWGLYQPFAVVPGPGEEGEGVSGTPVTVVGPLCTPEDTLARDVTVDAVRPGDVVVFGFAGAYGWEFALPSFLGHPPATRAVVGTTTRAAVELSG